MPRQGSLARLGLTVAMLGLMLTVAGCSGSKRSCEPGSARRVSGDCPHAIQSSRSSESLCSTFLALARADRISLEVDAMASCMEVLDQRRRELDKQEFLALAECANRAEGANSFLGCVDAYQRAKPWVRSWTTPPEGMSEEDKIMRAKVLFMEGLDYRERGLLTEAINAFEEAYYLVPSKHGFAFEIGITAWHTDYCPLAHHYLEHYVKYADPVEHAEKLATARTTLAEISISGCAPSS